jgi:hypothetical protein
MIPTMPITIPRSAEKRSASRRKGDRSQLGIVIGIISESRSPSRNGDRHRSEYAARHAEQWGFTRFWTAEHHNMPGIASPNPLFTPKSYTDGSVSLVRQ